MFFTNSNGILSYADAERDEHNDYVFSDPVATDTASPVKANPSVISYLNPIEEKKGLLVTTSVGNTRSNGRIMTFLASDTSVLKVGFEAGAAIQETVPAIYPHSTAGDDNGFAIIGNGTMSDTFGHEYNSIDQTIERAEFAITKPLNGENEEYVVYSPLARRYFNASNSKAYFVATRPDNNVIITKTPGSHKSGVTDETNIGADEFSILSSSYINSFNIPKMRFDGQGSWHNNKDQLDTGFTLL